MRKKIKLWIFTMSLILIIHIVVNMVIGINGLKAIKSEHIIYHPDFENVDIDARNNAYIYLPLVTDINSYEQVKEVRLAGEKIPFIVDIENEIVNRWKSIEHFDYGVDNRMINTNKIGKYILIYNEIEISEELLKRWLDQGIKEINEIEFEKNNGEIIRIPMGSIEIVKDDSINIIKVDREKEELNEKIYRETDFVDIVKLIFGGINNEQF